MSETAAPATAETPAAPADTVESIKAKYFSPPPAAEPAKAEPEAPPPAPVKDGEQVLAERLALVAAEKARVRGDAKLVEIGKQVTAAPSAVEALRILYPDKARFEAELAKLIDHHIDTAAPPSPEEVAKTAEEKAKADREAEKKRLRELLDEEERERAQQSQAARDAGLAALAETVGAEVAKSADRWPFVDYVGFDKQRLERVSRELFLKNGNKLASPTEILDEVERQLEAEDNARRTEIDARKKRPIDAPGASSGPASTPARPTNITAAMKRDGAVAPPVPASKMSKDEFLADLKKRHGLV